MAVPAFTNTIEAEAMELDAGYIIEPIKVASGGQAIKTSSTGTAQAMFSGAAGSYMLSLGTFEENDGVATLELWVNDVKVQDILLDEATDSPVATESTKATHIVGPIELAEGDIIMVRGIENNDEVARLDFISLELQTPDPDPTGLLLEGDDTNNILTGSEGNDTLIGNLGRDRQTGGEGADIFRYTDIMDSAKNYTTNTLQMDMITDFEIGVDKIDVSGLGFTGLGDGLGGTLDVEYNSEKDRTYIKSREPNAEGFRFEIVLQGDKSALTEADFLFDDDGSEEPEEPEANVINGTEAAETIVGTAGVDLISGLGGNDIIDGTPEGEAGAGDTINGGAGKDTLTGGDAADIFVFSELRHSAKNYTTNDFQADGITNFQAGTDKIDVSALGFTGLGDGLGTTLTLFYSATSDRTFIKNREEDVDGYRFELFVQGDQTATLAESDFVFA